VTRDHDVSQLTTAEPELAMRQLRANLRLISQNSPAHVPIRAHVRAIEAELAGRADSRQPQPASANDGGILPGPSPATLPGDVDRDKEAP
jgi:hypothetical protein